MTERNCLVFNFANIEVREREFLLIKGGERLALEPTAFRVLLFLLRNPGRIVSKEEIVASVWNDVAVSDNSLTRAIAQLRRVLDDDPREPRYILTVPTLGYRFLSEVSAREDSVGAKVAAGARSPDVGPATEQEASSAGEEQRRRDIFLLRKASGENPSSIETVPQRSYRVVGAELRLPHAARDSGLPLETAGIPGGETTIKRREAGRSKGLLSWLLPGTAALVALLAVTVWYLHRPLPPPKITGFTQLTHDSQSKQVIGTDGSRLYVVRFYPSSIAQIGIANGEIEPIPMPFRVSFLFDVSPDGSSLLVSSSDSGDESTAFENGRVSLWIVQLPGGSLRHLTDGAILGAAWSPDGQSVVCSTREGDVFVIRKDGTRARTLIASQGQTPNSFRALLSWSPDGKKIQFSEGGRLWEMSSDGSGLHQILTDWHPSTPRCCGRWTPDGRFFLFLSDGSTPDNSLQRIRSQIWALDERRGLLRQAPAEPIQLTSTPTSWGNFIPSKDGKSVFAESVIPRGELVRYDVKSHQLEPYLGGISAEFLTFSPDGKSVAYVTFPEGILWRANRDGSTPMQLTEAPLYPIVLRWSPDGTQILFMGQDSEGHSKGYIVTAQGGTPRPIRPEDTDSQNDPNWSPDGRKIVFSTLDFNKPAADIAIRVLDLATHQVTTLPGSDDTGFPRWSPNGRFIAALTYSSRDLKVFDFETQRWSVLQEGETGFPEWSRDGKFIYFLRPRGNSGVYRIRPSGGEAERIVDLKGFRYTGAVSFWMGLDPEDTPLLLRDTGRSEIYALTLEER